MSISVILLPAHNPGPMTGPGNNTYLLLNNGEATLVDAGVGHPRHLEELGRRLSERSATLTQVLVTHAHPDHALGAAAIGGAHPQARFRKYPWPDQDASYPVGWESLGDGDRVLGDVNGLTVVHTPGHSPDHLAFWNESSGDLFTGDLVVLGSSVMIHSSGGGDLQQYLQSLERVRALKPRRLLPAHGPEVTDPEALLTGYLDHRRLREQQVMDVLQAGRDTVESITESIYDGLEPALMPAARETVRAHLDKLKKEQRAFEENGRWKT